MKSSTSRGSSGKASISVEGRDQNRKPARHSLSTFVHCFSSDILGAWIASRADKPPHGHPASFFRSCDHVGTMSAMANDRNGRTARSYSRAAADAFRAASNSDPAFHSGHWSLSARSRPTAYSRSTSTAAASIRQSGVHSSEGL